MPRSKARRRSLAIAALAALVALGVTAGVLLTRHRSTRPPDLAIYGDFDHIQRSTVATFNELIVASKAGTLSDADFASRLEVEVLGPWRIVQHRLLVAGPPPAALSARHAALVAYVDARIADLSALDDTLHGHGPPPERMKELRTKADVALQVLDHVLTMPR